VADLNGVFPQRVLLDTTNVCNARCPFCPLFHGDSQIDRKLRPATVMSQELYEKLVFEMAAWPQKPNTIIHSANAEFLQDPKLLERLDVLKRAGMGQSVLILTNGQFLSARVSEAIVLADIREMILGFDGASKEVYEKHRVRCDYETVLDNVRGFVRMREKMKGKTRVWIKYVRTLRNAHEVEAAYAMFSEFMDPELDRFQDALAVDWGDNATTSSDLYYVHKVRQGSRRESCYYFDNQMMIHPDGLVGACCWDYNLNISSGGFGNVAEGPMLDIWRSEKRVALGAAHRPGSESVLPEKCKTCITLHEPPPLPDELMRISRSYLEAQSETSFVYRFPSPATQTLVSAVEAIA
jgi:MoaA/NifB/PqqE/SkfB family radical SAM enzyme